MKEGILRVFSKRKISQKGEPVRYEKKLKSEYFYTEDTVGMKRYFAAMQLDKKVSKVVKFIFDEVTIEPDSDFIEIDGEKYSIIQSQVKEDENGEMYNYVTLERSG